MDIERKFIMKVLEEENRWLTFDELFIKVQPDCDWIAFAAQLEQLVKNRELRYILPSGADVGYYGWLYLKATEQDVR